MNLEDLARAHLESTMREGKIILETGETRVVATPTIVALSKALAEKKLSPKEPEKPEVSAPNEMFSISRLTEDEEELINASPNVQYPKVPVLDSLYHRSDLQDAVEYQNLENQIMRRLDNA